MKIGIVSYLPKQIKERRKKAVISQYNFLRNIFPEKELVVVAQQYEEEDYIKDKNIRYIKYENGIGVSKARNIVLKEFYDSDEDFLLLLDDDVILYDYYDCVDLLKEIDSNPNKFKGVDSICANHPKYLPFKKENYLDKNILTHWKFEKKPFNTCGAFTIYRNIRKFKNKEVYFNERSDGLKVNEDVEFHINWVLQGNVSFVCPQMQMKEIGANDSTIFTGNRIREEKTAVRNTLKAYPFSDEVIVGDKLNWKYLDRYNRTRKKGYIKRDKPTTYKENEIPT